MKKLLVTIVAVLLGWIPCLAEVRAEEKSPAQKRILMERGEKVTGARLELVRKVIESYRDCEVIAKGNELTALRINGKLYQDFTLIVRDSKRLVIVVTPDGVVSFDF